MWVDNRNFHNFDKKHSFFLNFISGNLLKLFIMHFSSLASINWCFDCASKFSSIDSLSDFRSLVNLSFVRGELNLHLQQNHRFMFE